MARISDYRFMKICSLIFFSLFLCQLGFANHNRQLSFDNSQVFRSWLVKIIEEQIRQGPSPKWVQRDCVGLVRFAVLEAAKAKDLTWKKALGIKLEQTPPDLKLTSMERNELSQWVQYDGQSKGKYISAIGLIQNNATFISKDINQAKPGDLLFYDMQDSQHLMVWMGKYVAYHNGETTQVNKEDNGLRKYNINELVTWKDSRWRPKESNPNFIGIFRLMFLSY